MLANLTLADLQIQIAATLIVIVVVAAVSFVLGRLSMTEVVLTDEQQAEVDRIEATIREDAESRKAQMTPFRGPLGSAIDELPDDNYSRAKRVEWLLRDIADECKSTFVDPEDMSPEWRDITRRINELTATPVINDQPSTIDELYTEHSPQIPELRKPSGPFGDDWRGGEYGGSNSMLMRNVKEKEVED